MPHKQVNKLEQYTITLDKRNVPIIEIALTEFMTKVFDLARESKCLGHGLEITKVEVPDCEVGQRA